MKIKLIWFDIINNIIVIMGIRLLNRYLKDSNVPCIQNASFSNLENKKIVIDIYNYIYRFLGNNRLLEELDIFCKILHKYNIRALFVFDGKYGEEKKEEQEKRRKNRNDANILYEKLSKKYKNNNKSNKIKKKLLNLNRERVKLTKWDVHDVKKYLEFSGMKYIVAEGEAEELCCELVNKNKVYACMSEDTDLFALGCKRIIKAIHMKKETFTLWDLEYLLNYEYMTMINFRMICTLSCNDYCNNNVKKHFIYFKNLFEKYPRGNNENIVDNESFILWLLQNEYICESEQQKYFSIKDIYDISNKNLLKHFKFISLHNGVYNKRKINTLMIDRKMYLNGEK